MGYACAAAGAIRGWHVDLVSGPVSLAPPPDVTLHRVTSAAEMLAACEPLFVLCDLFIAVAAVADYRPKTRATQKHKKNSDGITVELVPTVDVLKTLGTRKRAGQIVVGFAAETDQIESYARAKLVEKNLDWIVANDVSRPGIGFNAEENAVLLIGRSGTAESFGPHPKLDVANFILSRVAPATA